MKKLNIQSKKGNEWKPLSEQHDSIVINSSNKNSNMGLQNFNHIDANSFPYGKMTNTNVIGRDPANIRSIFAKFNPKKAGIPLLTGGAGGAFMSSNLLAAPSGQPEFREAPMSLLDKAKKYAADSYEYAANEGGPVGKFLYSGGAEALKDIEQGTTPMVKTGRLPAMPTGAALANLLELLQL